MIKGDQVQGGSPIVEAARDRYELVETEITVLAQRINNKDAHRFNYSGAPRLGNVWVFGREDG